MKLLILFIVLNVANVIIQTIKSIATIRCGKLVAALVNAIAYGLYTVVIVYMVCEIPLWQKVAVVALANLIGVYVVKLIEQKMEKTKLWKIEANFAIKNKSDIIKIKKTFNINNISCNYIVVGSNVIFNLYCYTKKETNIAKDIIKNLNGKSFVTEARTKLF